MIASFETSLVKRLNQAWQHLGLQVITRADDDPDLPTLGRYSVIDEEDNVVSDNVNVVATARGVMS